MPCPGGPTDLAAKMGWEPSETASILETMANKGLCMALTMGDTIYYQSARFMPGILGFQFMPGKTTERDKKLARLIDNYKKAFNEKTENRETEFPTNRVITVDRTVAPENQVHT